MGTRSLTDVITVYKDGDKKKQVTLLTMYRQYDGYPEGMGVDLAEFLSSGKLVNGISMAEKEKVFNGAGCLAAQMVSHFKGDSAGGFYIEPPKARNCGEEYIYQIIVDQEEKTINLRCQEVGYMVKDKYINKTRELFMGTPQEFFNWLNKPKENLVTK